MDSVAENGLACVIELGPGRALSRLGSARHPAIPVRAAEASAMPAPARPHLPCGKSHAAWL
jgi:hypothetical protein